MTNTMKTPEQIAAYDRFLRQGRLYYRTERAARDYAEAMAMQETK